VLHGATATLTERRVLIVEFEYHGIGLWRKTTIREVVGWLGSLGYICFWNGNNGKLAPFLPNCDYEFKRWANVVCTCDPEFQRRMHTLVPDNLQPM
jgi:hypothetical protein